MSDDGRPTLHQCVNRVESNLKRLESVQMAFGKLKPAEDSLRRDLEQLAKTRPHLLASARLLELFDCSKGSSFGNLLIHFKPNLTEEQYLCVMLMTLEYVDATVPRKLLLRESMLGLDVHRESALKLFSLIDDKDGNGEKMISTLADSWSDYLMSKKK